MTVVVGGPTCGVRLMQTDICITSLAGGQVVAGSNPVSPTVMARVKAVPEKSGAAFSVLGLGPDLLERDSTTQDLLRRTMA